jgi:hypothetical protein
MARTHMKRNKDMTYCSRWVREVYCTPFSWRHVTCKNCLRHKPGDKRANFNTEVVSPT